MEISRTHAKTLGTAALELMEACVWDPALFLRAAL